MFCCVKGSPASVRLVLAFFTLALEGYGGAVCEEMPPLSHSTLDLRFKAFGVKRVHLFAGMSVIITISQQRAQVRSLSKFAQVSLALINTTTCDGCLISPRKGGGGRVVRAVLPSCLMERGNLRVIDNVLALL